MVKEKKISIKEIVKKLKSNITIYYRITYDRKSNFITMPYLLLIDREPIENKFESVSEAESFINSKSNIELKSYLKRIIRYEIKVFKEKFTLKNFADRLYLYSYQIISNAYLHIEDKLLADLGDYITYKQFMILKNADMLKDYPRIDLAYSQYINLPAMYLHLKNNLKVDISEVLTKNQFDYLFAFIHFLEFTIYSIQKGEFINNPKFAFTFGHWFAYPEIRKEYEDFVRTKSILEVVGELRKAKYPEGEKYVKIADIIKYTDKEIMQIFKMVNSDYSISVDINFPQFLKLIDETININFDYLKKGLFNPL